MNREAGLLAPVATACSSVLMGGWRNSAGNQGSIPPLSQGSKAERCHETPGVRYLLNHVGYLRCLKQQDLLAGGLEPSKDFWKLVIELFRFSDLRLRDAAFQVLRINALGFITLQHRPGPKLHAQISTVRDSSWSHTHGTLDCLREPFCKSSTKTWRFQHLTGPR